MPTRFLHDCRRTAARNLIRASVPERVAMLLTGHKSRAIFDRYNIIHEQELLDAGDQLVEYLAQQVQTPRRHSPPAGTAIPLASHPTRSRVGATSTRLEEHGGVDAVKGRGLAGGTPFAPGGPPAGGGRTPVAIPATGATRGRVRGC